LLVATRATPNYFAISGSATFLRCSQTKAKKPLKIQAILKLKPSKIP
jgi:hypothetical protein